MHCYAKNIANVFLPSYPMSSQYPLPSHPSSVTLGSSFLIENVYPFSGVAK
ncbi:MAG: hypothetical protein ACR5LA_08340 [Wolbachia sp.]